MNQGDVSSRLRVNVGCGATPTTGWLNFDNSLSVLFGRLPLAKQFLGPSRRMFVAEIRRGTVRRGQATKLPLANSSVEALYSSHMLEHISRPNALRFLAEAKRVLKPGGILRLAVPDLRQQAEEYLRAGDADAFLEKMLLAPRHSRNLVSRLRLIVVGSREHAWMYDGASLSRLVRSAGFTGVVVLPPGETRIVDAGGLDLREREDESVYVEAVKPE